MTSDADRPLQAALDEGREAAFAELYDRFAERLYAVALTITSSAADAEDAVHDTFISVWRSRRTLAQVGNLQTYLFTCLRRAAVRVIRQSRQSRPVSRDVTREVGRAQPAVDRIETVDRSEELQQALADLPAEQREVVSLKIDGGLTFAELATVLGVSANTAASRYRLALEKMRAALKNDD